MNSLNNRKSIIKRTIIYIMVFLAVFQGPMPVLFAAIDDVTGMIEGAAVVHGVADGSVTGNTLTVTTGGAKTIINYDAFNINTGWKVNFQQPGSDATTLNRVVAANPSQIDGMLQSNGRIFLINPAGVMFGSGAVVNVTQLVASALDMSDADFLSDKMLFSGTAGSVTNAGTINAQLVSLIGTEVTNTGHITCPDGYVILAAGDSVYLKPETSGILVEVTAAPGIQGEVNNTGIDPTDVKLDAGTNGTVILAAAGDPLAVAVSNTGSIKAGKTQIQASKTEISNSTIDTAYLEFTGDASIENTSVTGNISADNLTLQGTVNATGSVDQEFEATLGELTANTLNKNNPGNLTLKGFTGINLNNDVTVDNGDLNIADDTTVTANTILKAGNNITIGTGKTVSGQTALTLEATAGSISGGSIGVTGSSLTLIQSAPIDLSTMTFSDQGTTELSLHSTGGYVTADSGANAADQWSSIIAKADNGNITLTGSDPGTITIAPNGDLLGESTLSASGNVSVADSDGVDLNANVSGTNIDLNGAITWDSAVALNAGTDIILAGTLTGTGAANALALNFGTSGAGGTLELGSMNSLTGTVTAAGGAGTDTIAGTTGDDTFTLTGDNAGQVAGMTFSGVEVLNGAAGNDTITGTSGDDTFTLSGDNAGNVANMDFSEIETLNGADGSDTITGTSGNDSFTLTGDNAGNVANMDFSAIETLEGADGSDTITGTSGDDSFTLTGDNAGNVANMDFSAIETLGGAGGSDTITGTSGDDSFTLTGDHAGNVANMVFSAVETLEGAGGSDTITGTSGNDAFALTGDNAGNVANMAFSAMETLNGAGGIDTITGTSGNDVFALSGNNAGNVANMAFAAMETLNGATGSDDTITGTSGNDAFVLSGNNAGNVANMTFAAMETLNGAAGSDTLTGTSGDDTFTITGANTGQAAGMTFSSIEALNGAAGDDQFNLNSGLLNFGGSIDGGSGTDELKATDGANIWAVSANNAGSLNGITTFSTMETLTGGTGSDMLMGTAGDDNFILTGNNAGGAAGMTFSSMEMLNGANGNDTITGTSDDDAFTVIGSHAGNVMNMDFAAIETLNGAAGNDQFNLNSGVTSFDGSIDGGSGTDELKAANGTNAWTVSANNAGTLNTTTTFSTMETLTGGIGSDMLMGTAGDDNFTLTGNNAGGAAGMTFTSMEILNGATGNDTITGTSGDDSFTVIGNNVGNVANIDFAAIETLNGSAGSDTITGTAGDDNYTITGVNAGGVAAMAFGGIETLNGAAGNDSFTLNSGVSSFGGSIDGGSGTDELKATDGTSGWTVTANNTGTLNSTTTFGTMETLAGGTGADSLTGTSGNDTFTLTGANSGGVAGIAFTGMEALDGAAGDDTYSGLAGSSLSGTLTDTVGTNTLNGNIAAGSINLTGDVTLATDTTLTGSSVTFGGAISGAGRNLKIAGDTTFNKQVGTDIAKLASVQVTGQTAMNYNSDMTNSSVATSGDQQYDGAVALGGDTLLTGKNMAFGSTVSGSHEFAVNASGQATLNSPVHTSGNIEVSATNDIQVNGSLSSDNGGVKLVTDTGFIYTNDGTNTMNVAVTGTSSNAGGTGVDLPGGTSDKAAIVIISKTKDLSLGTGAVLTANGSCDPTPDERSGVLFYDEGPQGLDQKAGIACDVAIYLASYFYDTVSNTQTGGNLGINSSGISCSSLNATVVLDAMDTVGSEGKFGDAMEDYFMADKLNFRIEAVSRTSDSKQEAMFYQRLPYLGLDTLPWGVSAGDFVYRGKNSVTDPDAQVMAAVLGYIDAPVIPVAVRPLEFKAEMTPVDMTKVEKWAEKNLLPLLSGQSDPLVYVSSTDYKPRKTLIDLYEHYQVMVNYLAPSRALERVLPEGIATDTETAITMNWLTGQIAPMTPEDDKKLTVAWINSIAASYVTFLTSTELKATDDMVKYYIAKNLTPLLEGEESPRTAFVIDQLIGGFSANSIGPVGMN